jgi:carboxyl-terminal processing protease
VTTPRSSELSGVRRADAEPGSGEFVIDFSGLTLSENLLRLIANEKEEFEAVLGRKVDFRTASDEDPAWVVEAPAEVGSAPTLQWQSDARLASVVATESDLLATMNALHTLCRTGCDAVVVTPAATVTDAIDVVRAEIANTYPSFALRGLDWESICDEHLDDEVSPSGFADMAAAWVAKLGDAHTSIRTSASNTFNPDYRGMLHADGVHLTDVPRQSAAWEAGVRAGWVVTVDEIDRLMRTVGATPQQLAEVRARRAMGIRGTHRIYRAHDPSGTRSTQWEEAAVPLTLENAVQVEDDKDGSTCIRVRAFASHLDLHSVFDDVIASTARSDRITIDLRGNTGGSILLATDLRDRFLRERTKIGYVTFTDGRGGLAPRAERWAEPSERRRWEGRTEILIDSMTYSASEDFVLGLQGLDHVRVSGSVSGGGSGRPRRVPLLPGVDLTISTAITYDRQGNPVEFRGIRPDRD